MTEKQSSSFVSVDVGNILSSCDSFSTPIYLGWEKGIDDFSL